MTVYIVRPHLNLLFSTIYKKILILNVKFLVSNFYLIAPTKHKYFFFNFNRERFNSIKQRMYIKLLISSFILDS